MTMRDPSEVIAEMRECCEDSRKAGFCNVGNHLILQWADELTAALPSSAPPAGEPFGHYFRDMEGRQHFHTGAQPPSFAQSEVTKLYTTPQPASADVVDARRWRFVRENLDKLYLYSGLELFGPSAERIDAAIDAAMAPTKEPT